MGILANSHDISIHVFMYYLYTIYMYIVPRPLETMYKYYSDVYEHTTSNSEDLRNYNSIPVQYAGAIFISSVNIRTELVKRSINYYIRTYGYG